MPIKIRSLRTMPCQPFQRLCYFRSQRNEPGFLQFGNILYEIAHDTVFQQRRGQHRRIAAVILLRHEHRVFQNRGEMNLLDMTPEQFIGTR